MILKTLNPISPSKDLFLDSFFNSFLNDSVLPKINQDSDFKPGVNIFETEKAFEIQMALPGMRKEDVRINLNENALTISGERFLKKDETTGTTHYSEIREGKFSRSFTLPETIVSDSIEANFVDGILEITLPKSEPKVAKTIEIK